MDKDNNTTSGMEDEKQANTVSEAGRQSGGANGDDDAGEVWTILGCGYLILCCAVLLFLVFSVVLPAATAGVSATLPLGIILWTLAIPPVLVMVWQATHSGKKLAITAAAITAPLAGAPAAIGLALLLAAIVFLFRLGRKTRSTMPPTIAVVALFVLPNLHPILAGVTLTHRERRHPAQEIMEKVAMPESLFLQVDTVRLPGSPGIGSVSLTYVFFKNHLLRDYLCGARLKILAAKNDRGELALYRLEDEPFWATTLQHCRAEEIKLKATLPAPTFEDKLARIKATALLKRICSRVRENIEDGARIVASPEELPPMRYRARLRETEIRLPWWPRWLLRHTQRMDIYDNTSGRRIAWAERHDAPTWWGVNLIRKMAGDQATTFNLNTAAAHEGQLLRFMEEVLFSPSPPTPPR